MSYLMRLASTRFNYWAGMACDAALCAFLVIYAGRLGGFALLLWPLDLVAGAFFGSAAEYCWHRWLFHNPRFPGFDAHMRHHHAPQSAAAMPFFLSPVVAALLILLLVQVFPLRHALLFCAGAIGQYSWYGFVHHVGHHLQRSPLQHLQAFHKVHHRLPDRNFGVTSPFWDWVFGTHYKQHR